MSTQSTNQTPPSRSLQRPVGQVDFSLLVPIEIGGVERAKLTVRRPKARDIKAAYDLHGEGVAAEFYLLGSITDLTVDEIGELDSADLKELQELMASFRNARSKP